MNAAEAEDTPSDLPIDGVSTPESSDATAHHAVSDEGVSSTLTSHQENADELDEPQSSGVVPDLFDREYLKLEISPHSSAFHATATSPGPGHPSPPRIVRKCSIYLAAVWPVDICACWSMRTRHVCEILMCVRLCRCVQVTISCPVYTDEGVRGDEVHPQDDADAIACQLQRSLRTAAARQHGVDLQWQQNATNTTGLLYICPLCWTKEGQIPERRWRRSAGRQY